MSSLLDGFDTTGIGSAGDGLLKLSTKLDTLLERSETAPNTPGVDGAAVAESVVELRRLVRFVASDSPALFSLVPKDRRALDVRKLAQTIMQLHLWCEYPGEEHQMDEPYEFKKDAAWFAQSRGLIAVVSKVMRLLPVVSSAAGVAMAAAEYDKIDEGLRLMGDVGTASFALAGDVGDSSVANLVSAFAPDGIEARMLKQLLLELDPLHHFCGLVKANSATHGPLWVCGEHQARLSPGLPVIGGH